MAEKDDSRGRRRPIAEETATLAPAGLARGPLLVALSAEGRAPWSLPRRGEVVIGSEPECDIVIAHPSVAPRHAVLKVGPRGVLKRVGERSRVRVDGLLLGVGESAEVASGAIVEIGEVHLLFQRHEGSDDPKTNAFVVGDHHVVIGASLAPTREVVRRAAQGDLSVMFLGETGVGKDVFAEMLHRLSPRADGPFVRVHAAALSPTLFESELFGHERGAFTGAIHDKPGLVELADGGTLMLDEIGEVPATMQVKLLRFLEDGTVTRLGSSTPRPVDVRFVSATHRDLLAEVERGSFRRDLYYRLSGVVIRIPPLRERRDDIVPLATELLSILAARGNPRRLTDGAKSALAAHDFPGNVRELRLTLERACVLAAGDTIDAPDLAFDPDESFATEDSEAAATLRALAECAGNQTEAARRLGISRRTLVNRLATIRGRPNG
ncbi:MAG: sigma 54-interacting transcriptional regulator [Deltaproteobacteria bacterium]|nr:sigma 54-interacting transcriptional regulator [Deltaproteobacteria bacterium]